MRDNASGAHINFTCWYQKLRLKISEWYIKDSSSRVVFDYNVESLKLLFFTVRELEKVQLWSEDLQKSQTHWSMHSSQL